MKELWVVRNSFSLIVFEHQYRLFSHEPHLVEEIGVSGRTNRYWTHELEPNGGISISQDVAESLLSEEDFQKIQEFTVAVKVTLLPTSWEGKPIEPLSDDPKEVEGFWKGIYYIFRDGG